MINKFQLIKESNPEFMKVVVEDDTYGVTISYVQLNLVMFSYIQFCVVTFGSF